MRKCWFGLQAAISNQHFGPAASSELKINKIERCPASQDEDGREREATSRALERDGRPRGTARDKGISLAASTTVQFDPGALNPERHRVQQGKDKQIGGCLAIEDGAVKWRQREISSDGANARFTEEE